MKRKLAVSVLAALTVMIFASGTVFADLPGGGWVTNTQVQNIGLNTAQVSVVSYGPGGPFTSVTKPADPGGSATFLNTELGIPAGFKGAGIIQSTEPVFAILFVTNYGTGAGNTGSAIVRGVGEENTSTDLSFPLAKLRWGGQQKTTTFYIQNAGTATTTATATFLKLGGTGTCTPGSKAYDIAASEQINFTIQDLGCPLGVYGSLTVSSGPSGQPLAGIVLEHDHDLSAPAGGTKVLQGSTGFSPADYDTTIIAPIIKKGWGKNKNVTGLQVQNVGPAPIPIGDLKVTYKIVGGPMGPGTEVEETNTAEIPIGGAFNSLHGVLLDGTLASAVVEVKQLATQRIVGIVNENRPLGSTVFRNTTYSMLPAKSAATSVSLPLVKEFFGGGGGRCTGVQVVAVGGTAVMELTYKAAAGTWTVTTNNPEASKTFLYLSDGTTTPNITITGGSAADMRGKNFGVTATSKTAGVKLVAVANESFCSGVARDEDDANYEGFALP